MANLENGLAAQFSCCKLANNHSFNVYYRLLYSWLLHTRFAPMNSDFWVVVLLFLIGTSNQTYDSPIESFIMFTLLNLYMEGARVLDF